MNKNNDHYKVLGLTKACSSKDIKKNFHKLALKYHPDKHDDKQVAEDKFNEIHNAYTVLGNQDKRDIYDSFGQDGLDFTQKCDDMMTSNNANSFNERGFRGSDKSAFDVLRDIIEDREEDADMRHRPEKASENYQTNFRNFMNKAMFNEDHITKKGNFCDTYVPTFMNNGFNSALASMMRSATDDRSDSSYFSFSSTVLSGDTAYTNAQTTVIKNGNVKTTSSEKYSAGDKVFENSTTNEYHTSHDHHESKSDTEGNSDALDKKSKNIRKIPIVDQNKSKKEKSKEIFANKKAKQNSKDIN